MATKKKVAKKKVVKKKPVKKVLKKKVSKGNGVRKTKQSVADNVPMRLRGTLYHRMRSEFAEFDAANAKLNLISFKLKQLMQKPEHKELVLMIRAEGEARKELTKQGQTFALVQKEVAKKFNIPFEEVGQYTFDTESGILLPPGPPPRTGT